MGRSRRRFHRRQASQNQRSSSQQPRSSSQQPKTTRLPCGCDAAELATQMGMSVPELLRAARRAEHPDAGGGPMLVTFPYAGPPPRTPPDDDAHLHN